MTGAPPRQRAQPPPSGGLDADVRQEKRNQNLTKQSQMPQPADTTRTAPVAGGTSVAPDAGDRWHPRSAGIDAATTAAATIVAHTAATANDAIATDTHSLLHPTSPHAGSCHAQQHAKPSSQGDTKLRPARAVTTKTPAPHGMATRRTHSHAVYARQYDALPGIGAGVPTCPSIRHLLIRFNTDTPHYPQCRTSRAAQQQSQSQHQHQPLHGVSASSAGASVGAWPTGGASQRWCVPCAWWRRWWRRARPAACVAWCLCRWASRGWPPAAAR